MNWAFNIINLEREQRKIIFGRYWSMKKLFILLPLCFSLITHAQCIVKNSQGQPTSLKYDALYDLLKNAPICPPDVSALKTSLRQKGFNIKPAMVANSGFHNPQFGNFSFFESVIGPGVAPGDFFFGHFSGFIDDVLSLDQEPARNKLLIELIVWDPRKELFNFYELRGKSQGIQWFYRGDSSDALADNRFLYQDPPPHTPKFGERMRCSACHVSGGPIMKELVRPHNDWWVENRPLPLRGEISNDINFILRELIDANNFSSLVMAGINKLEKSLVYKNIKSHLTLQERLRPLFCETEINLESDPDAFESSLETLQIPAAFFVNPKLSKQVIKITYGEYQDLLVHFRMSFPDSGRRDADHAWLTPVKGYSDHQAVESLINDGIIDNDFVAKVYSIDMKNPILSTTRCELLKLLPLSPENWKQNFVTNLKASTQAGAQELADLLENPRLGSDFFQIQAQAYLQEVQQLLTTQEGAHIFFKKLLDLRTRVFESEISTNPLGQILEPGFKIVFPVQAS